MDNKGNLLGLCLNKNILRHNFAWYNRLEPDLNSKYYKELKSVLNILNFITTFFLGTWNEEFKMEIKAKKDKEEVFINLFGNYTKRQI